MSWLVDVEFRPSKIEGMGIFARHSIREGTRIWKFDRSMHACDSKALGRLDPERLKFALHGGYFHRPSGKFLWYTDGMHFMNHGSGLAANTGLGVNKDDSVALRNIAAGEELYEDYTSWSSDGLRPDHWLFQFYIRFHPGHFAFLNSLEQHLIAV